MRGKIDMWSRDLVDLRTHISGMAAGLTVALTDHHSSGLHVPFLSININISSQRHPIPIEPRELFDGHRPCSFTSINRHFTCQTPFPVARIDGIENLAAACTLPVRRQNRSDHDPPGHYPCAAPAIYLDPTLRQKASCQIAAYATYSVRLLVL